MGAALPKAWRWRCLPSAQCVKQLQGPAISRNRLLFSDVFHASYTPRRFAGLIIGNGVSICHFRGNLLSMGPKHEGLRGQCKGRNKQGLGKDASRPTKREVWQRGVGTLRSSSAGSQGDLEQGYRGDNPTVWPSKFCNAALRLCRTMTASKRRPQTSEVQRPHLHLRIKIWAKDVHQTILKNIVYLNPFPKMTKLPPYHSFSRTCSLFPVFRWPVQTGAGVF